MCYSLQLEEDVNGEKIENTFSVLFHFISLAFIFGVSIIGCSDTPVTGSMLQPSDVDKYTSSSELDNL